MIPVLLELKNFGSHKESYIDFQKLGSIIFVVGNEDGSIRKSNAVGKSTLFNAIKWIVFGATPSNKANKIIREGEKKAEGTFIFKMSNGDMYKIYRHRTEKNSGVDLFQKVGDEWKTLTGRRASDVDQMILDIVGINLATFENTSYFKQNDLMNLANATTLERKKIISSMLELGIWGKYRELAQKKKKPYDTELVIIDRQISELGNPEEDLIELQNYKKQYENNKKKYSARLKELKEEFAKKSETLTKLKDLAKDRSQIERKYNDSILLLQETKDNLNFITTSIDENSSEAIRLSNSIETKKNLINDKVAKLADLVGKMPQAVDLTKYDEERNELARHTVALKEDKALLKVLNNPLPTDAICPTCTTTLDENHRSSLIASKKARIIKIQEEISNIEDLILLCEDSIRFYEKKILEYNTAKSVNGQLSSEIADLNKEVKASESLIEKLNERLLSLRDKENKAKESVAFAQKAYDEIKTIKVTLMSGEEVGEFTQLESCILKLQKEEKEVSEALQQANTEIGRNSEKINQAESKVLKLKEAKQKKEDLDYTTRLYDAAMFAFSTKGIPFMIINSVLDSIQEETNKVLKMLRNNMQTQFLVDKERKKDGEMQDALDMRFFVDMNEWDYNDLSGGQQGSVALALKFAMATVSRKRCGADIRMLLLDEVDQPLDEESVDAFYEILKTWSKDMTIMVITHNRQLKEKLDNYILVSKKNGAASATVV